MIDCHSGSGDYNEWWRLPCVWPVLSWIFRVLLIVFSAGWTTLVDLGQFAAPNDRPATSAARRNAIAPMGSQP
jgi:hypothetical protein